MVRSTVGEALRDVRVRRGMDQHQVGAVGHLDHSMISQIELGKRRLPRDVSPRVAQALDDGRLAMAVAEEASGGAMAPWLNGPAADLGRVATWAKSIEELEEALEAGRSALRHITRSPAATCEEVRQQIRTALLEIIEAITAGQHVVTVACREYGLSYRQLWADHRAELRQKGYITG